MNGDSLIARQTPLPFTDAARTATGEPRARVGLERLETLWFNTGTLCNLACANCYIESSPSNDRLEYLRRDEVQGFLTELAGLGHGTRSIGFTGGEPFMNPDIIGMLEDTLAGGYQALVLTNAMTPLRHHRAALLDLRSRYPEALTLRVSVDHFHREKHEEERGPRSWHPMLDGLRWLDRHGFAVSVAGRTRWGEDEATLREGFAALFSAEGMNIDAHDPESLTLFPEMDAAASVPEITESCWEILGVDPASMMCASSRMVVKYRDTPAPVVLACTLLTDDPRFELGHHLAETLDPVPLNHPHCARFCVLGGGNCGSG